MPKPKGVDEQIQKLIDRRDEPQKQTEAQIEQDILDFFRETLGFTTKTAQRQVKKEGFSGEQDIVLTLDQKTSVVVEIKTPDEFKNDKLRNTAIIQAADYLLCTPKQEFGIVTDGWSWIYFRVKPVGNFHRVHRILGFNIKEHRKVAQVVFKRTQAGTLKLFLKVLAAIHRDIAPANFDALMNLSLSSRVDFLAAKACDAGVKVSDADKSVIRELYNGGHLPIQTVKFVIGHSIDLKKDNRKHSVKPKKDKNASNTKH